VRQALDEKIAAADQPIRKLQDEMVAWRNEHNSEIFLAEAALGSHVESIQGLERTTQAVEAYVFLSSCVCASRWLRTFY
jgi:hypothetical protein